MGFEDSMMQYSQISQQDKEKTFIDKMLARDDTAKIKELIGKNTLTRSELLSALYYITSTEAKLVNYDGWERYIILKFFIWIQEFTKICEILYDYEDKLDKNTTNTNLSLTPRAKELFNNSHLLMQHNAKFLIMLYLNIARTSLSVNAVGLRELLTNRFEVSYPQPGSQQIENKGGFLGTGKKEGK